MIHFHKGVREREREGAHIMHLLSYKTQERKEGREVENSVLSYYHAFLWIPTQKSMSREFSIVLLSCFSLYTYQEVHEQGILYYPINMLFSVYLPRSP